MASYAHLGVRYRTTDGGPAQILTFPEAASQTFIAGDLVTLSSGKVAVAVAASATHASSDVEAGTILGVALENASGTTDDPVKVAIADDRLQILLTVIHGTPAIAVTAVAQVGVGYDVGHWTDGSTPAVTGWGYMIDDTSATNAMVVELDNKYAVGTQYGTAWCKIPASKRTLG